MRLYVRNNRYYVLDRFLCKKCGCNISEIITLKVNVGAYCQFCGKYIKFLNSKEREMIFGGVYEIIEKEKAK